MLTLTINAPTPHAMAAQLESWLATFGAAAPAAPAEHQAGITDAAAVADLAKPKAARPRPTPPLPPADKVAEQAEKPKPEEVEAPAITYADIQKQVVAHFTTKGREATLALLQKHNVDHASKLSEDQWPAVHADFAAALAA